MLGFAGEQQSTSVQPDSSVSSLTAQPINPSAPPQDSAARLSEKIESDLLNVTFLEAQNYLQNGTIQVIVQVTNKSTMLARQVAALDGGLIETFPEMSLAVIKIPYTELNQLAGFSYINHIYLDGRVEALDSVSLPIIEPPGEWSSVTASYGAITGASVKIAILDTGIDPAHPDFFFPNGTSKIINASDFSGSGHTWDGNGHGTHCASIASGTGAASSGLYIGVATDSLLMNAKVLGDGGSGSDSNVIAGIQWAVGQGANIISMSLGAFTRQTDGSDALCQAVDWATNQGVVCCVAAGNDGPCCGTIDTPGCAKTAITVGSCNSSRYIAGSSSCGPTSDCRIKPEVVAPGVSITAARANNTSLGSVVNQYYTTLSGTSMATPHVAGAVALIKQAHPSWTPAQIKTALVESANVTSIKPDDVLTVGGGLIDVANAITVTTFASNSTVSFKVNQNYSPVNQTGTLSFTPPTASANFIAGKCLSNLPFPLSYSSGIVTFSCPANYTSQWGGRITVDGGSSFKPQITIPVLAVATFIPPSSSSWTAVTLVNTSAGWPRTMAVAGSMLYVGDSEFTGLILEYSLPDMTLKRNLTVSETMIDSLVISDGYLYAGTAYGFVYQISLTSFTTQTYLTLPNNRAVTKLLVWSSRLYASTYDGYLYSIDPTNMKIISSSQIDSDLQAGAVGDSYLYFISIRGNLWKVDRNLQATKLSLGVIGFGPNSLIAVNGNLYAVSDNCPANYPRSIDYLPQIFKISYGLSVLDSTSFSMASSSNSIELVYDDNNLYVLSHIWSTDYTIQYDYFLRFNMSLLATDASLSYSTPVSVIPAGYRLNQFMCNQETIVPWNNYLICGFYSGQICLTRDLSAKPSVPTCISFNVNSTCSGQPSQISTCWHSRVGLSGYIASTNSSGAWVNQTWQSLTGTFATANYTVTSGSAGNPLGWRFWCNDSNNNWANTGIQSFNISSSPYYTLTILPSDHLSTNPVAGQYSYPSQTPVNLTINEATGNGYRFTNWLIDGITNQTSNSTIIVMNANHTVQVQEAFTNDTIEWERFAPIDWGGATPVSNYSSNVCSPYYAQTFIVGNFSHTVSSVKLYVEKIGSPTGPFVVGIRATLNGVPTGQDLANATVNISSIKKDSPDWLNVSLTYPASPVVLSANTKYAIVFSDTTDVNQNCPYVAYNYKVTQFSGGDLYFLNLSSSKWQLRVDTDGFLKDMPAMFQVWGQISSQTQYSILASAGANGAINPSGTVLVNNGSSQLFSITPDAHYHVADVLVDGVSVGAVTSYNFPNVQASHTISASFAIDSYNIAASAAGGGSISPSGTVSVTYGNFQSFTITANANYHIVDVLVDSASVGAITQYNFTNVVAAHTIAASFAADTSPSSDSSNSQSSSSVAKTSTPTPSPQPSATLTPNPTVAIPTTTPTATPEVNSPTQTIIISIAVALTLGVILGAAVSKKLSKRGESSLKV